MDNNLKLQKSFVYVVLGLFLSVFVAVTVTAVRCYTVYSFRSGISVELKMVLWNLMLMPSVVLPIALWFSNMMNPVLSRFSLVSVLLTCCYFIAVPRLYKLFDPAEMAIVTSVFAFFLISCCLTVVIKDIRKKSAKRWINIILGILLTLVFALMSAWTSFCVICFPFMDRLPICFMLPVLCLIYALGSFIDIYSPATVILTTLSVGYATLCAAFDAMNQRYLYYILVGLLALTVIWQVIDIIKYIRSKNNDSKSCNA